MIAEGLDDVDDIGVAQEHEASSAVVVRERTKWFRPHRDPRVQLEPSLEQLRGGQP